ncbi:hypothetical protein GCM10009555_031010 [Acrocarpospora macrocephala]|uniref:Uncharacterized protein n=1 Tax=Acrocarpospora macrocephala TaxID=150177 RepID=A0A5M3WW21_9ACTN|nr:hypothetical protein [Acrocarpospora macrocephala]GES12432.1 hypothetical protein Amac_060290 [Acrocarpospora macrocephala]
MSDDGTRLAGKLSIWLASLFAIVALIVGLINLFLDEPVPVPLDLVAGYLLGTLASFIAYVYGRSELILERQDRLLHQPARGVQVFTTSEEFLRKLVEITVGAATVSTLNLSPAKGEHPELDRYFEVVHSSIKNRKSQLRSFRSIASVDTVQKSAWLVERSCELHQTGRVSFAIFDQDRIRPLLHPLSLHITYKDGNIYVFIFPPVNLTGSMDSILISDPVLGKAMLDYYNLLWHDSLKINEGRQVRSQGLDRIVQLNPEIDANPFYQSLRKGLTL